MPGQLKIVSVTMAPVNRNGISRPMFVMIGSIALRSACRKVTTPGGETLGTRSAHVVLAERVQHAARTNRLSAAMFTTTSVMTGRIRWLPTSAMAAMGSSQKATQ